MLRELKRDILVNKLFCPEDIVDEYLDYEESTNMNHDVKYLYPDMIFLDESVKEKFIENQNKYYRLFIATKNKIALMSEEQKKLVADAIIDKLIVVNEFELAKKFIQLVDFSSYLSVGDCHE